VRHDAIFDALGDGTRRRIFGMIRRGPLAVGDIAGRLPVSQPAVSQHLRVLREAGLVEAETLGRRRIYRVRPEGFEPLRAYVSAFWDEALEAFGSSFTDDEEAGE
jgi:DNA-binding transcriptional ArsR family regulator